MYVNKIKIKNNKKKRMRGCVYNHKGHLRKALESDSNKKVKTGIKRAVLVNTFGGKKEATKQEDKRIVNKDYKPLPIKPPKKSKVKSKGKQKGVKERSNNYIRLVEPRLKEVEEWSKKQVTEREISRMLGISYSSYNSYKVEYPELQDAIDHGRSSIVTDVKGSLYKSALGYSVTEVTINRDYVYKDGVEILVGKKIVEKGKYIAPDTSAAVVLLKQYDRKGITGHSFTNRDEKEEVDKKRDQDIKEKNGTSTGSVNWEGV